MVAKPTTRKSVTWRVLSSREDAPDAGYWTSCYMDKADAQKHRQDLKKRGNRGVAAFEVTSVFMMDGDKTLYPCQSQTWVML